MFSKFIITPLHRSEDISKSYENFKRQGPGWIWIVVEDYGKNICVEAGIVPDVLLHSDPHVSHARNAALDYVNNQSEGPHIWVNMDADDYYGPGYADQKANALWSHNERTADISTSLSLFIQLGTGELIICPNPGPMGSTLAGWSDCERYPVQTNEDGAWFELMNSSRNAQTDPSNHIYQRTGRGVWDASDKEILASFRMRAGNDTMWSYGVCSETQAREIASNWDSAPRTPVPLSVIFDIHGST